LKYTCKNKEYKYSMVTQAHENSTHMRGKKERD